ncbi:MAG: glycerophosphodiester phosphodiesterase family protein [Anaeromyxobacteraceae bacterium]
MTLGHRVLAAGFLVLLSSACMSREGAQPPTFSDGGLVARSVPLPNPWSLPKVLDGVYDTSSRFGANVVVHASQWGGVNPGEGMTSSVSLLAGDHAAFAVLQPGCFRDTTGDAPVTRLVLEGHWRYLDVSEPDPTTTGLVRLFVSPQEIVDWVCDAPAWDPAGPPGDPRPPPAVRATLTGATGNGVNAPGVPLTVSWVRARKSRQNAEGRQTFFVGARQGGCKSGDNCGISGNTPEGAILAAQLGADYLEIDVRLTKDQVPIFLHQGLFPGSVQGLYCTGWAEDYTYAELLANCRLRNGEVIPRVADMLEFIYTRTNLPTWLDSKSPDIIVPVSAILAQLREKLVSCNPPPPGGLKEGQRCLFPGSAPIWQRGIISLPSADFVTEYQQALAAGQLAPDQHCLVEEDPSALVSIPCVAWKPRYTLGPQAAEMQSLQQQGFFTGYWTVNDLGTMDALLTSGVPNGILTNRIGLLNQRFEMVGITPPYAPWRVSAP